MATKAMSGLRDYAVDEVLRDGGSIHIRAMRPDDKGRLLDHFNRLSPHSIHFRFFGAKRRLTEAELVRFTEVDFVRNVALVATLRREEGERFIGVGRYMATAEGRAEVAFAVADEHQGRGIATVLLEHLAAIARTHGVEEFEADVLGENNQMLRVFRKSGYRVTRSTEAGVVHLSFPTEETRQSAQASLERDTTASAESMRRFLEPKSVAVIGASARPESLGGVVLRNLRRSEYTGAIHAVHPAAAAMDGLAGYARVGDIGQAVDLALVAVPAEAVAGVVRECAGAGVRAVVVLSPGFAEASEEGRKREREVAQIARESGLRLVGPNSLGVLNTDPAVRLDATCAATVPAAGNVAISVQSGALGGAILDYARTRRLGLSSFVSLGNKADVSSNDVLSYWMDDARTRVIALYLESFGNPRRFARLAPQVARRKPIVAVKAGRGEVLAPTVRSSGLSAGMDVTVDALFQQAGVIRTDTIEEMFGVLALLSTQPLPAGPRVGVVTNSSGPDVLLADACKAGGLQLAPLDQGTGDVLRHLLGADRSVTNPVDLGSSATAEQYENAIDAIGADACVDAVVAVHIPSLAALPEDIAAAMARAAAAVPAEKPVLTVFISAQAAPAELHTGPRGPLPTYAFPENAALALAAAERYGRWRRRPRGTALELDSTSVDTIRAVVDRVRAEGSTLRWLESRDFATVLRAAGIASAWSHVVAPEEAPDLAETLGYPLVAKAVAPGLVHRGEVGCIVLGLDSKAAVSAAVSAFHQRTVQLGLRLEAVLLQREYRGGLEALAGVTSDPLFGPLVACGLGGVVARLVRDVAVRLPPVTDIDAAEMVDGLRSARLLQGYRGIGPGDREALQSILVRLSSLVEVIPEMTEMELDPIEILAPGQGAIVLDGRIQIAGR